MPSFLALAQDTAETVPLTPKRSPKSDMAHTVIHYLSTRELKVDLFSAHDETCNWSRMPWNKLKAGLTSVSGISGMEEVKMKLQFAGTFSMSFRWLWPWKEWPHVYNGEAGLTVRPGLWRLGQHSREQVSGIRLQASRQSLKPRGAGFPIFLLSFHHIR